MVSAMVVLVTGGCGFIGSHTVVSLIKAGYTPILLDNYSNSTRSVLDRLADICGSPPVCIEGDIRDRALLDTLFTDYQIDAVVHFAAWKSVGASCLDPFGYYDNNIQGTQTLLEAMSHAKVKNLIFSSSATVYDSRGTPPYHEDALVGHTTNPYGTTKLIVEQMLQDMSLHLGFKVVSLRYFNPIGAHESGLLGEDPKGVPSNLFPYILKVVCGELPELQVFGDDYPTSDGSGVRDYIHIMDLAEGHVAALAWLSQQDDPVHEQINLGTGSGTSVFEMITAVQEIVGTPLPFTVLSRRSGDIAVSVADVSKAQHLLGWTASRSIKQAIQDGYAYYQQRR